MEPAGLLQEPSCLVSAAPRAAACAPAAPRGSGSWEVRQERGEREKERERRRKEREEEDGGSV